MACEFFAQHLTYLVRYPSSSKASLTSRALRSRPCAHRPLSSACHSVGAPVPEFLLPSFTSSRTSALKPRHNTKQASSISRSQSRRAFSSTKRAQAAVITANPRKDEDGNEMAIDITARAANVRLTNTIHNGTAC